MNKRDTKKEEVIELDTKERTPKSTSSTNNSTGTNINDGKTVLISLFSVILLVLLVCCCCYMFTIVSVG
jgi:hypothetical protein